QKSETEDARSQSEVISQRAKNYAEVAAEAIAREMTVGKADVRKWRTALDVVAKTLYESTDERVRAEARARKVERTLDELRPKRQRLSEAAKRLELVATARVTCEVGKTTTVELTYMTGGASWRPAYEARAASAKVDLSAWATVVQSTGEDWKQ